MAKEQLKEGSKLTTDILESLIARYSHAGFQYQQALDSSAGEDPAAIVWGAHQGVTTPRIFLLALLPGNWDKANPDYLETHALERMPTDAAPDEYAQFAVVADTDGHEVAFDLAYPPHEIDRLPA